MATASSLHAHNIHPHEVAFLVRAYLQQNGFSESLRAFEKEASDVLDGVAQPASPAKSLRSLLGEYMALKAADLERNLALAQPNHAQLCSQITRRVNQLLSDYAGLSRGHGRSQQRSRAFSIDDALRSSNPFNVPASTSARSSESGQSRGGGGGDGGGATAPLGKRKRKRPPRRTPAASAVSTAVSDRAGARASDADSFLGSGLSFLPDAPGATNSRGGHGLLGYGGGFMLGVDDFDVDKIVAHINRNSSRDGFEHGNLLDTGDPLDFVHKEALQALAAPLAAAAEAGNGTSSVAGSTVRTSRPPNVPGTPEKRAKKAASTPSSPWRSRGRGGPQRGSAPKVSRGGDSPGLVARNAAAAAREPRATPLVAVSSPLPSAGVEISGNLSLPNSLHGSSPPAGGPAASALSHVDSQSPYRQAPANALRTNGDAQLGNIIAQGPGISKPVKGSVPPAQTTIKQPQPQAATTATPATPAASGKAIRIFEGVELINKLEQQREASLQAHDEHPLSPREKPSQLGLEAQATTDASATVVMPEPQKTDGASPPQAAGGATSAPSANDDTQDIPDDIDSFLDELDYSQDASNQ